MCGHCASSHSGSDPGCNLQTAHMWMVYFFYTRKCTCTADSHPVPSRLPGIPLMTAAWTRQLLPQGSPPHPTGHPWTQVHATTKSSASCTMLHPCQASSHQQYSKSAKPLVVTQSSSHGMCLTHLDFACARILQQCCLVVCTVHEITTCHIACNASAYTACHVDSGLSRSSAPNPYTSSHAHMPSARRSSSMRADSRNLSSSPSPSRTEAVEGDHAGQHLLMCLDILTSMHVLLWLEGVACLR